MKLKRLAAMTMVSLSLLAGTAYGAGPGDGLPPADGMSVTSGTGQAAVSTENRSEIDLSAYGTYVTASYGGGTAGIPSTLYHVLREEGNEYVCERFGTELRLSKDNFTPVTKISVPTQSDTRKAILQAALSAVGKPYAYGGNGPDSFDCSGFVNYCYKAAGLTLPRTSSEIGAMANITEDAMKPGDMMWKPGHVAIYLGDGLMIHAEGSDTGIVIGSSGGLYTDFINAIGD